MQTTMTAIEAHKRVAEDAKKNIKTLRTIDKFEMGMCMARQGDVYMIGIPDDTPVGDPTGTKQVVEGTTMGSRHCISGFAVAYKSINGRRPKIKGLRSTAIFGPIVKSKKRFVLNHPEHADFSLPAGCYQVMHQVDARTLERVRD